MAVLGRPHHHRTRAAASSASTTCPSACSRRRSSTPPVPAAADAHRELLRISARALGIATIGDLRDYFRLSPADMKGRLEELVEAGELAAGRGRGLEAARPICTATPACRAGSTPAPCSRPSIRSSGSAPAPSACSTSATASRSTRRPKSGSTAIMCCPSCSATRIVARVDLQGRPAGRRAARPRRLCRARRAARHRRRTARRTAADAGLARPGAHGGRRRPATWRPGRSAGLRWPSVAAAR